MVPHVLKFLSDTRLTCNRIVNLKVNILHVNIHNAYPVGMLHSVTCLVARVIESHAICHCCRTQAGDMTFVPVAKESRSLPALDGLSILDDETNCSLNIISAVKVSGILSCLVVHLKNLTAQKASHRHTSQESQPRSLILLLRTKLVAEKRPLLRWQP